MDYLNELVCEFRNALDIVATQKLYGRLTLFRNFPNGCCRYASDLLAEYLINKGVPRECIQMAESETRKGNYTHCWLIIDDMFCVDITADQFNGKLYFKKYEPIPNCCIVPRGTYLYEFFDNSKTQYLRNVGIDTYSEDVSAKLQVIYDSAIRQIQD